MPKIINYICLYKWNWPSPPPPVPGGGGGGGAGPIPLYKQNTLALEPPPILIYFRRLV